MHAPRTCCWTTRSHPFGVWNTMCKENSASFLNPVFHTRIGLQKSSATNPLSCREPFLKSGQMVLRAYDGLIETVPDQRIAIHRLSRRDFQLIPAAHPQRCCQPTQRQEPKTLRTCTTN